MYLTVFPLVYERSSLGNTERNFSNTLLDVLPVKGPQGPLLQNSNVSSQNNIPEQHAWTVQPEVLVLRAPTLGMCSFSMHFICSFCIIFFFFLVY